MRPLKFMRPPFATLLYVTAFLPLVAYGQTDLQQPFVDCGLTGSITIYDYKNHTWTFSDSTDASRETLPASTFKVINSLIALETGVIPDEHEVFKWDGVKREIDTWNADTDLESAFKNSTVWYYVALARKIGEKRYAEYLRKCSYGNGNITSGQDGDFWNYGDFGVSPQNQIKFLQALYEEKLPFSKRTFQIVKRIMVAETTDAYVVRAKTGWTNSAGKSIGWWVGYVERKDNVYFFATRLIKPRKVINENFANCRKEVTRKILKQLGIMQ